MVKSKSKGKGTKIKKRNKLKTKLTRQGKSKMVRHKKPVVKSVPPLVPMDDDDPVESDHGEDMLEMVDAEDLQFLKQSIVNKSYKMFDDDQFRKLTVDTKEDGSIEEAYEKNIMDEELSGRRTRLLLPIKTEGQIVKRAISEKIPEEIVKGTRKEKKSKNKDNKKKKDDEEDSDDWEFEEEALPVDESKTAISVAEMLAWRQRASSRYKFRIGILCSGLLEDPEGRVQNIKKLLDMYDEWHPELLITLKKLVIVSLGEVFKDILPGYIIKHQDQENVRLKKDTRKLQNFEKSLLKGYRGYLTRLEKLASRLYRKKGDTRRFSQPEIKLGELSVKCLCDLVVTHPYFNYSTNIVQLLAPYLDNQRPSVRKLVFDTFTQLFKTDKRGEITLHVVRKINELVKKKKHRVNPDVIEVLLSLKLDEINLNEVKEQEAKHKKALEKKKRILNLSKKERKRQQRLEEVEKELIETKGEENRQSRKNLLTEATKFVFAIYFRILKSAPTSGLLCAVLAGLAKFACCVNVEVYVDTVRAVDELMKAGGLSVREQLHCVKAVFALLAAQGGALAIDPAHFIRHLYALMFEVSIGSGPEDCAAMVECVEGLITGRKLTPQRTVAYVKRLATVALNQDHHVCLAALAVIRFALQTQKITDVLMDTDPTSGQGVFLPELPDPEHCNAASTSLYEFSTLQRHYHPVVRQMALHLAYGAPSSGPESLSLEIAKLGSKELCAEFDPAGVKFNPPVSTKPGHSGSKTTPPIRALHMLSTKYMPKEWQPAG